MNWLLTSAVVSRHYENLVYWRVRVPFLIKKKTIKIIVLYYFFRNIVHQLNNQIQHFCIPVHKSVSDTASVSTAISFRIYLICCNLYLISDLFRLIIFCQALRLKSKNTKKQTKYFSKNIFRDEKKSLKQQKKKKRLYISPICSFNIF